MRIGNTARAVLAAAIAIGVFMAASCVSEKAKAEASSKVEPEYRAPRAATAPVADGVPDDPAWEKAEWAPIDQVWIGSPTTPDDYTGHYKAVWTPDRLYVLMRFTRSMIRDNYGDESTCWEWDCAEIFIDEDHSGGNHQNTYNAFAYHMTTRGNAWDQGNGGSGWVKHNDSAKVVFKPAGNNVYYWEIELKVFGKDYVHGKQNTPKTLESGKRMGFSAAYNTNDGGSQRKNMFGSHYIPWADKNTSWITASDFGDMILVD